MKRVLIVDDWEGWRNFHKTNIEYLNLSEVEIDMADSAYSALSKIQEAILEQPYDVIITDLQMETNFLPKFAGQWLVEQIKTLKQYDHSKIIIISGSEAIKKIAKELNVLYVPKIVARNSGCEI